jgi:hypothetical protein
MDATSVFGVAGECVENSLTQDLVLDKTYSSRKHTKNAYKITISINI